MADNKDLIAFGPIPSRRLGKSLGINNIPPKICTYSCVYCQVGLTRNMSRERKSFYGSATVVGAVIEKIREAHENGEEIDYLTFAPDGEPTLDRDLGEEIKELRETGMRVAVITNSSLIGDKSVRKDLSGADWVSLKVDSVLENVWRRVDRPHRALSLENISEGIAEFTSSFKGFLATETMLISGINDTEESIEATASFISGISPDRSYISVPTRPPALKKCRGGDEAAVNRAYQVFTEKGVRAEILTGYEGNEFAFTGDVKRDILSITSVHPMKKEAVEGVLAKAGAGWPAVEELLKDGSLLRVNYKGEDFFLRKI